MLVLVMKACIHETLRHLANANAIMNNNIEHISLSLSFLLSQLF